ncbi:MAG: family transcriptional regulator [Planctomycetaceae bacterium]|nr:family transcriptional regulator [Planctomycetaceae bacterium]
MPDNHEDARVTNRIRRLRFDHDEMTQQALAEKVGVTRQTIIALEAGKYFPSLLLAFRLAAAFGVRIEDVFQFEAGASIN